MSYRIRKRDSPQVYFEDVAAALEWLPKAFGFRDVLRDGNAREAANRFASCTMRLTKIERGADDVRRDHL